MFGIDTPLQDLLAAGWKAAQSGFWSLAVALVLLVAVTVTRKYGSRWVPFFGTDAGGVLLLFLGSAIGAVSSALAAGQGVLSWAIVLAALRVGVEAGGGYGAIKKLLVPWLVRVLPSWLGKPIEWLFSGPAKAPPPLPDAPQP